MRNLCLLMLTALPGFAQPAAGPALPHSQRMADAFMARHPDSIRIGTNKTARWDYEQGLVLKALERVWERTGDGRYFAYIQRDLDQFVGHDGSIRTYKADEANLDNITTGRVLLTLAQQTLPDRAKYRRAADRLRTQLTHQPRTREGGFWHKGRYPYQMWLDGLYMAEPFYAEYTRLFDRQPDSAARHFDDIARQFALVESHLVDPKTGLLYHGYDESRQQRWANPQTGQSPSFWGRAMGWYAMALVDVLDYFPPEHPGRAGLVTALRRLMPALVRYQDPKTGCWFQVTDQGNRAGNYPEASASCMYVYALAKGVRLGYLDESLLTSARNGYAGILKTFVQPDETGQLTLNGTVSVGGLGGLPEVRLAGRPYRDGSYDYYLSEPVRQNDLKGVGPFMLASVEMEMADEIKRGRGKTVAVDYYFNRETRLNDDEPATREPFHYTWADRTHSGFYLWGNTFRELGVTTRTLAEAPTAANLKSVDVYILVDPDTPKETPAPNYVQPAHARVIADWVRAGGVLVLMANDTANCEIRHFNQLAGQFGIQFTDKNRNRVQGTRFEQGRLDIPARSSTQPIFDRTRTVYIKELATLALSAPARSVLTDAGDVIMAVAKVGKGAVFAVGDPWLYNEYTDGRRIPAIYQNFSAGKELAAWLLGQTPNRNGAD